MKEILKQKSVLYFGIAIIVIGIAGLIGSNNNDTAESIDQKNQTTLDNVSTITSNADGTIVSYAGQDGQTSLEILKASAEVLTEDSSFGEFVTTINGVEQTDSLFWIFYINGDPASVGAGDYVTKEGDQVEWKLEG